MLRILILLLLLPACLYAADENAENNFSYFSLVIAVFTVIVLFVGILVQKRWKK